MGIIQRDTLKLLSLLDQLESKAHGRVVALMVATLSVAYVEGFERDKVCDLFAALADGFDPDSLTKKEDDDA